MRAAQVNCLDGPGAVRIVDIAEPHDDSSVIIDVHAAGVAFPDVLLTRGRYQHRPELPFVLGGEVAGLVRSAPTASAVRAGDRVAALTSVVGGIAEVAATLPDRVVKLPDAVTFEAGAGLLFNDLTVHFALAERGRLRPGETVLVHGAAGGIGTAALRLAPAMGASRCIAVVSSSAKAEVARAAGASAVVPVEGFKDAVLNLTGGRGVDIVVDPVGGDRFTDSLRALAPGGRLVVVGFTGGDIPSVRVNRLLLNNIDVVGAGWGAWKARHPEYLLRQWQEVGPMLATGRVAAPQPTVYPMDAVAEALTAVERRSALGKVVVGVRP